MTREMDIHALKIAAQTIEELKAERDKLIKAHDTQCEIAKDFQKLFVEVEREMTKLMAERDRYRVAFEAVKLDAIQRACPQGIQWFIMNNYILELKAERDCYRDLLEAIRSQMCWEADRDQLTMGMRDLHTAVTKALAPAAK